VPRKLRQEVAGGVYHVFARGNRKGRIFVDDDDRRRYLAGFGAVARDLGWRCLAYCLMTNHVHHVIELREPNLARGMRAAHRAYAREFNVRHETGGGHLFQERYGATAAPNDGSAMYFVCYVLLNPVRAQLCQQPGEFPWSSYASTVGLADRPGWLDRARVLSYFGAPSTDPTRRLISVIDAVRFMGVAGFEPDTSVAAKRPNPA
jgi:putative transposase